MLQSYNWEPIDYLLIGHITKDLLAEGVRIGGTVVYSALMAKALGLRVGIVSSWAEDVPNDVLESIPVDNVPSKSTTTFQNIETPKGRVQRVWDVASRLDYGQIPKIWQNAAIVHLAPVANEVDPDLVLKFPTALIGITPQGWLRSWDDKGHVYAGEWEFASLVLGNAGAVVISIEDIQDDELFIEDAASLCPIVAVTEGSHGVRLYWNGDVRRFKPPSVPVVDTTGAGDIFATAFFARLYTTRDPWEAARFATQLSAISVTRGGLNAIPSQQEIRESMLEVY